MSRYIKSKIDNKEYCVSNGHFSRHLRSNDLTYRDYYESYETGITPLCHCYRPLKFYQKTNSYAQTCGNQKCAAQIRNVERLNRTEDQIEKEYANRKKAWTTRSKSQRQKISLKRKETCLERYGEIAPALSQDVKTKTVLTNIERYGVEYPAQSEKIKKKIKNTNIRKYGNSTWAQSTLSENAKQWLLDRNRFRSLVETMNTKQIAEKLECDRSIIYDYINRYELRQFLKSDSYFELEVEDFLQSINVDFLRNNRSLISPMELDFFIPSHNLAIECNGDYWHSDLFRDKNYHLNKWKRCQEESIHLVQLAELDWNTKSSKVKLMISSLLNQKMDVMGARNFSICRIPNSTSNKFLEAHHLQGVTTSIYSFGAYDHHLQLRAVMTFGWTRGTKKSRRFELKRWVTDSKHSYPGLFSKVFKFAQKDLDFDKVVSFSMNDWFTGNVYKKNGFILNSISTPAYKYLYNNKWQHCSYFTKGNIRKKFSNRTDVIEMLDNGSTEFEIMDYLGILRTWDSGKKEWIWSKY